MFRYCQELQQCRAQTHGRLNNIEGNTYIFVETLSGFEVSNKCLDYIKNIAV